MYLVKKSSLKQEYIAIGISVFTIVGIIGAFYIMAMPPAKALFSVNAKIKKGRLIIPDASTYRSQYKELEKEIEAITQQIAKSKERLFWKKDIAFFLDRLSQIAEQLAVDFISIKPSLSPEPIISDDSGGKDDKQKTVLMFRNPINITMKAGYAELINFLARVEDSDRFLRIDELTIDPDNKDVLKRNVKMVLSIFSAD